MNYAKINIQKVKFHKFGDILSSRIIENLQSSQIPSGLSVSFTPQILQIIS
mgnify:CR=1 FL=1